MTLGIAIGALIWSILMHIASAINGGGNVWEDRAIFSFVFLASLGAVLGKVFL